MDHEAFIEAVDQYVRYVNSKDALMCAFEEETGIIAWGVRMKEPDFKCEMLPDMRKEFDKLVADSARTVDKLAPRARQARLKSLWREFVVQKMEAA